jgi:hypothetical protein
MQDNFSLAQIYFLSAEDMKEIVCGIGISAAPVSPAQSTLLHGMMVCAGQSVAGACDPPCDPITAAGYINPSIL